MKARKSCENEPTESEQEAVRRGWARTKDDWILRCPPRDCRKLKGVIIAKVGLNWWIFLPDKVKYPLFRFRFGPYATLITAINAVTP